MDDKYEGSKRFVRNRLSVVREYNVKTEVQVIYKGSWLMYRIMLHMDGIINKDIEKTLKSDVIEIMRIEND